MRRRDISNYNVFDTTPMVLNDRQIQKYSEKGMMIAPYKSSLIREVDDRRLVSFGQSSYGYDIRLSSADFRVFESPSRLSVFLSRIGLGKLFHLYRMLTKGKLVIDPKNFDDRIANNVCFEEDATGKFFLLSPYTYALGVSMERFQMPRNVTGICNGKSTYARSGLIVNVTPLEAGWVGYLTLEFFNATPYTMKLYAEEGVAQIVFLEGEPCSISYSDRAGKYQNQSDQVVLAKV